MAPHKGDKSRYQLPAELCEILKSGASFRDTAAEFIGAARAPVTSGDTQLDPSLRLHRLIEDVAGEIDGGNADRQLLLQFLNAEYTLFAITSSVELPLNAYLIHWLECIAAWEKSLDKLIAGDGRGKASQASVEQQTTALIARLELVQRLLMDPSLLHSLGETTADIFLQHVPPAERYTKFDVQAWIKESIGRQSIIWEDETAMSTFRDMITAVCPLDQHVERPLDLANLHKRAPDEVYSMLQSDPAAVRLAILRMPFSEIDTFDVFNRLLDFNVDEALYRINTDRQQLIRDFLQCALNSLEGLSEATEGPLHPPALDGDSAASPRGGMADAAAVARTMAGLREREARAVQLVAMFVKGLFRSGHVVWTDIEWQLKELTARYSWVAEVKDLPRLE